MQCRVEITVAGDKPVLIKREEFMRCVDEGDLACRNSTTVLDQYLAAWFHSNNGDCFFNLPAFYLKNGRALFINGRHRTILLSRHLDLLPMALTQLDQASKSTLDALVARPLLEGEVISLPDLPIVEAMSNAT